MSHSTTGTPSISPPRRAMATTSVPRAASCAATAWPISPAAPVTRTRPGGALISGAVTSRSQGAREDRRVIDGQRGIERGGDGEKRPLVPGPGDELDAARAPVAVAAGRDADRRVSRQVHPLQEGAQRTRRGGLPGDLR